MPVLATIAWAEAAGVRLSTLWDTVYGFRADAARVIADGTTDAPERRAWILLAIALGTGLLLVLAGPFARLRELWHDDPPVTAATVAVVLVDVASLAAGGSFWQDYLLPLIPGAALCTALLAGRDGRTGRTMRGLVVAAIVSAVLAMAFWLVWNATGHQEFDEVRTGEAIAESAEPGDTLVVFGGRADLQRVSGLDSPYPYLWSLPMRTRDPEYADLTALLGSAHAPTWLVEWVDLDAWADAGVPELRAGDRRALRPGRHHLQRQADLPAPRRRAPGGHARLRLKCRVGASFKKTGADSALKRWISGRGRARGRQRPGRRRPLRASRRSASRS